MLVIVLRLYLDALHLHLENAKGTTVKGSVTGTNADNIVAEGADDLDNTSPDQLTGSAVGDAHTLRTTGVDVSLDSDSATVTTGDNAGDDYATFKIVLEEQLSIRMYLSQLTRLLQVSAAPSKDGADATV